jgi:hypothetical protein
LQKELVTDFGSSTSSQVGDFLIMGARGPGSKPATSYFQHFDNPVFPPEKFGWTRYCRNENIPPHLLRRLKHRRMPSKAQNCFEALIILGLIDDDDMDEIAELNPAHPTVAMLKRAGDW